MEDADNPLPSDCIDRLVSAHSEYKRTVSEAYDDALPEVIERISGSGSVGKADIGALVLWKRISASTRWATQLMSCPDQDVRKVTAAAVERVNDGSSSIPDAAAAGRSELAQLPGFTTGDALASAVLFVAAPTRMAVYDRRSQAGLKRIGLDLSPKPGRYGRYMGLVERLAIAARDRGHDWQPRDVDLALYLLGGARETPPVAD